MKKLLYLLRHAHVDSKGVLLGRTDVPLSDRGKEQAQYWQKALHDVPFQAVWFSPLQRTRETAEIIMKNNILHENDEDNQNSGIIIMEKVSAFTEISLGSWDGRSKAWIQQNDSKRWLERGANMECVAPPDGESFKDLHNRVVPAFNNICQQAKHHTHSLLIGHQAVNRVILAHILGVPLLDVQSIEQEYACLNIIDITDGLRFVKYDSCPI